MFRYSSAVRCSQAFIGRLTRSRFHRSALTLRVSSRFMGSSAPKTAAKCSSSIDMKLPFSHSYESRHIGPQNKDTSVILKLLGVSSLSELMNRVVPAQIRKELGEANTSAVPLTGSTEVDALRELQQVMSANSALDYTSFLGQGYYGSLTPKVILRNIIENPSWYTPYTPYQAEISQGRLEMLLNYQTMVASLVSKEVCNASLLDESTACAEAMTMCYDVVNGRAKKGQSPRNTLLVSASMHKQNTEVVKTRAAPLGIDVRVVDDGSMMDVLDSDKGVFGVLMQYPNTDGDVVDLTDLVDTCKAKNVATIAATDLLASTLLKPVGEYGVDIVVGSSQRFGVPLGYGGPHAAFLACDEKHLRKMPGRIIGTTRDSRGFKGALRMALQVREQHIKRERATSNICTAQALLANVAASFGIYHGPGGVKRIATRVHLLADTLKALMPPSFRCLSGQFFDTVHFETPAGMSADELVLKALDHKINLRKASESSITVSMDQTTTVEDVFKLLNLFSDGSIEQSEVGQYVERRMESGGGDVDEEFFGDLSRKSAFMEDSVFHKYRSETAMMRYLYALEKKDLGLNTAMIPLGSCTMKLNAASAMIPMTWPLVAGIHPHVPRSQATGYTQMISQMEAWLSELTGFAAASLQPNSGAQGEYTGLLCIRQFHESRGDSQRDVCLIPVSAHGTNPASAHMVGYKVVAVKCDANGNVDTAHLKKMAEKHREKLACIMATYPSTHGVFEEEIREVCEIVHDNGGLVYMDGANFQAQLGYCSPGDIGADVCHLNLHKTFSIPHGGGGPGLGPITVNDKLAPFLPTEGSGHSDFKKGSAVSGAAFSSASVAVIPWMYIRMMGVLGLKKATAMAIANANYMMKRLEDHFPVLYVGAEGFCAHEFIVDLRPLKKATGVNAEDVAKRLMDYGFHAPTMSFPVADTLMIEPTESEPLSELNRLCDALIAIRKDIGRVESGEIAVSDSPLRGAPHTVDVVCGSEWHRQYSREEASCIDFFTLRGEDKGFWPTVGRVDNVYGDTHLNLSCGCPSVEELASE